MSWFLGSLVIIAATIVVTPNAIHPQFSTISEVEIKPYLQFKTLGVLQKLTYKNA